MNTFIAWKIKCHDYSENILLGFRSLMATTNTSDFVRNFPYLINKRVIYPLQLNL